MNIVDIASPGGAKSGVYAIYGAERWKRAILLYPKVYFDRNPKYMGHENITEVDEAGPLDYAGRFIMGVYNPSNGRGFGRVAPVEAIELFPHFRRPKRAFSSRLYFVTGGREEILSAGTALARKSGQRSQ